MKTESQRIFFVAGEVSGDEHAAEIISELLNIDPGLEVHGYGGPRMEEAGAEIHFRLPDLAAVGLGWVGKVFEYRRVGKNIIELCKKNRIQTLVLVDFPGFNLRVATAAKAAGLRVVYYIIPQVWAWRAGRLKRMARDIDLALVLFPFEKTLLEEAGIEVEFVGHPLVDRLRHRRSIGEILEDSGLPSDPETDFVGLLPGSRPSEVRRLAPVLRETAEILFRDNTNLHFIIPCSQGIQSGEVSRHMGNSFPRTLVENARPDLRTLFKVSITKSGTSTLENAILGVPQVIVYKGGPLEACIAKRVVRVPWLGLVNIIAEKEICPEFLQERCKPRWIAEAAGELLRNPAAAENMRKAMKKATESLSKGNASRIAADAIHRQMGR